MLLLWLRSTIEKIKRNPVSQLKRIPYPTTQQWIYLFITFLSYIRHVLIKYNQFMFSLNKRNSKRFRVYEMFWRGIWKLFHELWYIWDDKSCLTSQINSIPKVKNIFCLLHSLCFWICFFKILDLHELHNVLSQSPGIFPFVKITFFIFSQCENNCPCRYKFYSMNSISLPNTGMNM